MTLSPELRARLKPVIMGALEDMPQLMKGTSDPTTVTKKFTDAFKERLYASELTRGDLVLLAAPSLIQAFTKTLSAFDELISYLKDLPDDPE